MAPSQQPASAGLVVNRAVLRGGRGTRDELERWLGQVPVEALGLGPEEVLYVPRLAAPVPLRADVSGRAGAGAIGDRLRALLEGAERDPMTPPPRVGACRFSSRSRYLAWLAALWLRDGPAESRATFAAATGGASPRQWLRTALLRDGAVLVPFAAALARAGIAARWSGMLDPAELALAHKALADRFGLQLEQPETAAPARLRADPVAPIASRRGDVPAKPRSPARADMAGAAASLDAEDGRWRSLPPANRQLLLALIALARRPALAGADDFAAQLASHSGDDAEPLAAAPPSPAGAAAFVPDDGIEPTPVAVGAPASAAAGMSRDPVPPVGDRGADSRAGAAALGADAASVRPPATAVVAVVAPAADERFSSAYAGLLFLLNAFVALGLYPDFTEPSRARLQPSPLWLADRIGRFWFGAAYRRDSLCQWIAEHVRGGRLPGGWAVEGAWLAGFDMVSPPRFVERDGRATLWHRAGFPLADLPAARPRRLAALARRCGCLRRPLDLVRRGRRHRLPSAPDARWIACLARFLDARIRIAAGDPALGLASLALAGEVSVSDLELTARFRLDSHPVGLRMAGLDRDLGWQPAEGRSIGFRFE